MELLLLSNSTAPRRRYLEHALDPLAEVLAGIGRLVFVPFALADHDGYTAQVRAALAPLGVDVVGAHTDDSAVREADAIFVGGGNTFRLVRSLQTKGLMNVIRTRVEGGVPYIGSSAGTVIAAPTMRTTNDMPIVEPLSFDTLGLVPFQINPHYLDPDPSSEHKGETREVRITQFLEENDVPVLGLREGSWLRRSGDELTLAGVPKSARFFRRGVEPVEIPNGTDISDLLS